MSSLALERLRARADFMLALTERMVNVNSHSANLAGCEAAGALLAEALVGSTLQLTTHAAPGAAPHLCFATPAAAARPALLLIGHHDTVFPPGSFEGFTRAGDLACGPGVLDMKGGLALVASVLLTLDEVGLLAGLPLRFISVSDEEVGSPTSRAWLEQLAAGARCALVFEAGRSGDAIITARRGVGQATLTAHGKAAHAGNALAQGRNAIWALALAIDAVQRSNGSIPGASANVGLVRGGSARNSVPELASCELDLRFDDAAGQAALQAQLEQACAGAAAAVPGTRVEAAIAINRRPWARDEASAALCARYAACQRAAGLQAAEAPTIGGGSDANTVGALGLPTIDGLGPRGSGFHTRDEQIEISSLLPKAEALLRFLLEHAPTS